MVGSLAEHYGCVVRVLEIDPKSPTVAVVRLVCANTTCKPGYYAEPYLAYTSSLERVWS